MYYTDGGKIGEISLGGSIYKFDNTNSGSWAALVLDEEIRGYRIAFGGGEGGASFIDIKDGAYPAPEGGGTNKAVTDLRISPDGTKIALLSGTGNSVVIYDTASGQMKETSSVPDRMPGACRFSGDSGSLAVITYDGLLTFIDLSSGKEKSSLDTGVRIDEERLSRDTGVLQYTSEGDILVYARDCVLVIDPEKTVVRAKIRGDAVYIPGAEMIVTKDESDFYAGSYLDAEASLKAAKMFIKEYE